MKLHLESRTGKNHITAYGRGYVIVNRERLTRSTIVTPEVLITTWPPQSYLELGAEHFEILAELTPEMVILGTGSLQQFPASSLVATLEGKGIGLETMDTGAACRTYNILMSEGRTVAAALLMIRA